MRPIRWHWPYIKLGKDNPEVIPKQYKTDYKEPRLMARESGSRLSLPIRLENIEMTDKYKKHLKSCEMIASQFARLTIPSWMIQQE